MDIFTIYNGYDPLRNFTNHSQRQILSSQRQYCQLIRMLSHYVETSHKTEKVVHVYRSDAHETGYLLLNDHFKDLTAKNMENYKMENGNAVNQDDFLLNSLLDIVPEKIELHCAIRPRLYVTLTQVFSDVVRHDSSSL